MTFKINNGPIDKRLTKNVQIVNKNSPDFQKMLQDALIRDNDIKISAHAKARMDERDIKLSTEEMKILQDAMSFLEEKGSKESLMLYKDHAFIASIKNKTIITSMKSDELDIVTNIDSVIIIK